MGPEGSLDVDIAPDAALQRLAAAINLPRKRAFGVLKTQNEYAGVVTDDGFEIWERQLRAVHAVGTVRARRGGARVALRYALAPLTRVLLVVFFALYAFVAVGIALRAPDPALTAEELVITLAGAVVIAGLFRGSARKQRTELESFLQSVFNDATRS